MQTSELRKQIIDKINAIDDLEVLNEVYALLKLEGKEREILELTEAQKEKIEQGLKDIEEGKFMTNNAANEEIDRWLKR